jgi:hypothetical protein
VTAQRRGGRNACAETDDADLRFGGDAHSTCSVAAAATMESAMPAVAKQAMRMRGLIE